MTDISPPKPISRVGSVQHMRASFDLMFPPAVDDEFADLLAKLEAVAATKEAGDDRG